MLLISKDDPGESSKIVKPTQPVESVEQAFSTLPVGMSFYLGVGHKIKTLLIKVPPFGFGRFNAISEIGTAYLLTQTELVIPRGQVWDITVLPQ